MNVNASSKRRNRNMNVQNKEATIFETDDATMDDANKMNSSAMRSMVNAVNVECRRGVSRVMPRDFM